MYRRKKENNRRKKEDNGGKKWKKITYMYHDIVAPKFSFFLPSIHSTQTVAVPTCNEGLRLKKQDKIS